MARLIGTENADTLNGGSDDDSIYGLADNDILSGFEGDDRLLGGLGEDEMNGGSGNDTYYVDSFNIGNDTLYGEDGEPIGSVPTYLGDIINENQGEGVDTVKISVDFDLSLTIFESVDLENFILINDTLATNGTGNNLNNKIVGNNAENYLDGITGNDSLYGYAGDDILIGGSGNDRLVGDIGSDVLIGGLGDDILILGNNSRESRYQDSDPDGVEYFNGDGTDKIYGFVPGEGGDAIQFEGIPNIDVVRDGIDTKFYDDDTGNLLVTLRRTTGFTQADVGVNLFSEGNFAFVDSLPA